MRLLVFGLAGEQRGGIETFLLNFNKHMSEDCIFDYIIIVDHCIHEKEIMSKGGNIYYVTSPNLNIFKNITEFYKLLKDYKKVNNIVYFNLFSMTYILPIIISKFLGYKVILHSHNSSFRSKKLYYFMHSFNRNLLKLGKFIRFTNSSLSAKFMFGNGIKAELIYNAIEPKEFKFNSDVREKIRKEYGLHDELLVGFVGRLFPEKNPIFLIKIFNEIKKLQPNAVLFIAGEGHLKIEVEKIIKEFGIGNSVILLGLKKNISELYQAMDLFLLPSVCEGLGLVLIEAQASGLPCITSADVVPNEAKISNLLEYVSLSETPAYWAQRCLNLYEKADKIRENGYEQVLNSNFNIEIEAARFENLLKEINLSKE